MVRLLVPLMLVVLLSGCVKHVDPSRPMSRDMPLSYIDLAEIKEGSEHHKDLLGSVKFYHQPELEMYVTGIGDRLARVSERPQLPYRFFILDDDRVDIFSYGGGYIYVTRGMLDFVESEAQLAAVLAHEIAHVAAGAHTPSIKRLPGKKQLFLKALQLGAGAAAGAAGSFVGGPAGKVASKSMDGITAAVPEIRKQFQKAEELEADQRAVLYLMKANYDPRELARFLDRISKTKAYDLLPYINFLNAHPPYEERREAVNELIQKINFKNRDFQLRQERFASIRTVMMHVDYIKTESPAAAPDAVAQASPVDTKTVSS